MAVYVYIKNELKSFEADIRDLCMSFFAMQKIIFVYEDKEKAQDDILKSVEICENKKIENNDASNNKFFAKEKTINQRKYYTGQFDNKFIEDVNNIIVKNYFKGDIDLSSLVDDKGNLDRNRRLEIKSELKRQLYNYLSKLTGKKLLWGTLTGIRPVTIVTNFLEANDTRTDRPEVHRTGRPEVHRTGRPVGDKIDDKTNDAQRASSTSSPVGDIIDAQRASSTSRPELIRTGRPVGDIYKKDYLRYGGDAKKFLKEEFYVSDEKINELIEIAKKEIEVLDRDKIKNYKNDYSIYVGVPFCKSTCLYCSFTSFNIEKYKEYVDKYLDSLEKEMQKELHYDRFAPSEKNHYRRIYSPMSLYIGGGTPTSLNGEQFERMLTIIDKYIDKENLFEYTVEAGRPDTITEAKLFSMKKHGVTRISINPQTFNQKTLDLIGRKHKVSDVYKKFKLARKIGFDNINMDIILGLPNEHLIDVVKTLIGVIKIRPESLTVHSLALKRAARLNYELDNWTKNTYLAGYESDARTGRSGVLRTGRPDIPRTGRPDVPRTGRPVADIINDAQRASSTSRPEVLRTGRPEGDKRTIDKMFDLSRFVAKFIGLKPYYLYRQKNMAGNLENVGYSKDGNECIYNIMMMSERHTVFGFGCATTKEVYYENGEKRVESIEGYKSVIDYCKSLE